MNPSAKSAHLAGALAWQRFRRSALKTRYGREDACLDLPASPLSLQLGSKRPRRCLYLTKASFFRIWSSATKLPDDLAIFIQGGIPSRRYCEVLQRYCSWFDLPLLFVGDLDPLDLTIFAALRAGDPMLRSSPLTAPPVRYLGVDDRWLDISQRHVSPEIGGVDGLTIRMGATERKHLEVSTRIVPDLQRLVGPACLRLLMSGRKLELEGVGHPGHHRRPFVRKLSELLTEGVPAAVSS